MQQSSEDGIGRVLSVLIVGTFITILNSSLINIALPKLMTVFGVSMESIQWVVTGYTIALGTVIPLSGYLSNVIGLKKLYIIALGIFTVGSLLCGLSWNSASMIGFRIVQGIGGGIIGPVGSAILFKSIPPKKLGVAMGLYGIAAMAAPAIGPTLGGYILENLNWQMLFYMSIPFGIIGIFMGIFLLEEFPKNKPGSFDGIGFVTSTVGFIALFYIIGKWSSIEWNHIHYVLILTVGIFSLIMFVINEWMHDEPLLDVKILRDYNFTSWNLVACSVSMAIIGVSYSVPMFLQKVVGYTAMQTGLILLPAAISTAVIMPISGKLFDKWGYKIIMLPGLSIYILVSYMLSYLNAETSKMAIVLMLMLRGFALGMILMPPSTMCMRNIAKEKISQATALLNIMRQMSSTCMVAMITSTLQHQITISSTRMMEQVTPSNNALVDGIQAFVVKFSHTGLSLLESKAVAMSAIGQLIQKQAYIEGIDLVLQFMTIAAIGTFVFVLCMQWMKYIFKSNVKDASISMQGGRLNG